MEYVLTFLEGIFSFLSPCILPMLPIYLVYLTGDAAQTSIKSQEKSHSYNFITNTIAFVLGFTTLFVLLGATATGLGSALSQHKDTIRIVSGILMIIMGIWYMEIPIITKLTSSFQRSGSFINMDKFRSKPLRFGSSFLFGMAFSMTWGPCLGTWLSAALLQASQAEHLVHGMLLLFLFSLGLGLPFILISLLFEQMKGVLDKIKEHMLLIKRIAGFILLLLGVAMLTNKLEYFMSLIQM